MKKINLVYWNSDNYGDALSPLLIAEISGLQVSHKDTTLSGKQKFKTLIKDLLKLSFNATRAVFTKENLLAIGSIMVWSNTGSIVWGSGFMNRADRFKGGTVLAVRGRLTNNKLKNDGFIGTTVYGDPALLLPLWIEPSGQKKYKLGIIPHWKEVEYFIEHYGDRYHIIDLRTRDIETVTREIASCEYVLSTSLHGIIVAHAYHIPALWIKRGFIDTDGFKFHDYFSSVDIPFYEGFSEIELILKSEENWKALFEGRPDISTIKTSLPAMQRELLKVFPYPLKKEYQNFINKKAK